MGKRQAPPQSFNTVRHSNRAKRQKRKQAERIVLLLILGVLALLILSLMIFGICAFVNAIADKDDPATNPNGGGADFSPVIYQNITQSADGLDRGELILINAAHYFDPTRATGLKNIYENQPIVNGVYKPYGLTDSSWKLNETALNALNEMMLRYYEISGGDTSIVVGSAYRTAAEQEALSSSVLPGYSDHHSGYCLTLKYVSSYLEETHWIYENAHKYGFIVRYPEAKSAITGVSGYGWCFRYVGVAHATYMYQNNLCLEEYVDLLQSSYASGSTLKITDGNGASYEVYYVAKTDEVTTVRVPKNYRYTLSGDNERGYIVTVYLAEPIE